MIPNLASVISGFEDTLQFQLVVKTAADGDVTETSKVKPALWFEGNLQPLNPRELLVKPEGERKWKWWTLVTDMDLEVDTIIKDQEGVLYRVMASSNWGRAGYQQYQLTEGPGLG